MLRDGVGKLITRVNLALHRRAQESLRMPRITTRRTSSGGSSNSSLYGQGLDNGQAEAVFSSYIQAVEGTGGK
jgi:hypothetical protein